MARIAKIRPKSQMTERQHQMALIKWAKLKKIVLVHIPNEGKRNAVEGSNLKKMGLCSGFPDIFAPRPNFEFFGLFIELKRDRIYTLSEMRTKTWLNQQWWLDYLNDCGYLALRAYGWIEASSMLEKFYTANCRYYKPLNKN